MPCPYCQCYKCVYRRNPSSDTSNNKLLAIRGLTRIGELYEELRPLSLISPSNLNRIKLTYYHRRMVMLIPLSILGDLSRSVVNQIIDVIAYHIRRPGISKTKKGWGGNPPRVYTEGQDLAVEWISADPLAPRTGQKRRVERRRRARRPR